MMKRLFVMVLVCATISTVGAVPTATPKCSITIEALSSEVKVGSAIIVKIHLLNTGDSEISSRGPFSDGVDAIYQYDCRDKTGKSAKRDAMGLFGPGGDHPVESIKPGDSYDELIPINRVCDLSQPGKYTIQVSRTFKDQSGKDEAVKSNLVTITVLPADGPPPTQ